LKGDRRREWRRDIMDVLIPQSPDHWRKRWRPGEHFVQHHAERIEIGPRVTLLPQPLFRCPVERGLAVEREIRRHLWVSRLSQNGSHAKPADLNPLVSVVS
jgi:hypothetical protein